MELDLLNVIFPVINKFPGISKLFSSKVGEGIGSVIEAEIATDLSKENSLFGNIEQEDETNSSKAEERNEH